MARAATGRFSSRATMLLGAVCIGMLLASSPMSATMAVSQGDAPWSMAYTLALMATAAGMSIVYWLRYRSGGTPSRAASLLGVASYGIGSLVFVWGTAQMPAAISVVAGIATGIGAVPLALCTARAFAQCNLTDNLVLMGIAQLIVGVIGLACRQAEGAAASAIFSLCLTGGLALLVCARRIMKPAEPDIPASKGVLATAADLLPTMGIPLLGAFAYAVFAKPAIGIDVVRPLLFGLDKELLLYAAAAALLLAAGVSRPRRPVYATVYRVVVPIGIIAILVLQSFPYTSVPYGWASGLSVLLTALIVQFAMATALAITGSREQPPSFAVCPFLAVYGLGRLGSIALQAFAIGFTGGEYALYQVVMTIILALMLVLVLLQYQSQRQMDGVDSAVAKPSLSHMVEAACSRLAETNGLTARESEVLQLLARGYAPAYIADVLVLSDSTIRTHVKAIYRKMGISSREELLMLVEQVAD